MWFLPLLLALAGAGVTYAGQQKAADAQRRTLADAMDKQQKARGKSLKAASAEIKQEGPQGLQKDMAPVVDQAARESNEGRQLASAFAAEAGQGHDAGFKGAITAGSAAGAGDVAVGQRSQANRAAFASALTARAQRMKQLAETQQFIGLDAERAGAMLPYDMANAGAQGSGLRLAGGITSGVGSGLASYQAWQPAAGGAGAGVAGTGSDGSMYRAVQPNGRVVWKANT